MGMRIAGFAFGAFLAGASVIGASAWAADTGSGGTTPTTGKTPPAAATDACKSSKAGDQCKFQGRRGRELTGTCTDHNGTLACVPTHHGMHGGGAGGQGAGAHPMQ